MITRKNIISSVKTWAKNEYTDQEFIPGKSRVPVSGRVFNENDVATLVESSLDFWLTTGRFNKKFEEKLAKFISVKHLITTNSGSSANLLALSCLTSYLLRDRAIKPKDEVITVAAGFPTTVNPILQIGAVPVFVDVEIPTYNIDVSKIEKAITKKTKAIMIAHTLGNTFNLEEVVKIAKKHKLWLIEDCCDALGTTYKDKHVGTFGDVATLSFYPAHHITMGEGGAVYTDNALLKKILLSFRDWGRDCWCDPGKNDSCLKRFGWKLGDLPQGYDHKYTYSHLGYNLKITDMQAAVGLAQLKHLKKFIKVRKNNFKYLSKQFKQFEDYFILPIATENSDPSWFGFPLTLKDNLKFSREDLLIYLTENKIDTRLLFAGNITKQPYMIGRKFKVKGKLTNTDIIMHNTFWLGVYPGLNKEMLAYIIEKIDEFIKKHV